MPVLDGFAVARRLRQDKPLGKCRSLQSRDFTAQKAEKAYDAGFNAFLRKPFNFSNLIEEINCFLGVEPSSKTVQA